MPPIISVENLGKAYRIRHEANGAGSRHGYRRLSEELLAAPRSWLQALRSSRLSPLASRFSGSAGSSVSGPAGPSFSPLVSSASSEEFWALRDVSFEVEPGEVVGIIGRNGAGKSTLLKLLSRITEPTTGRIELNGRVASLLEVGTGFHPELTGRENIFLNGAILGMTRTEIRRKFDEIVDFAGVKRFIDTPVKRYSSGMAVRLGFAVAAHLEPEILIIDEVLSVGDAAFQKKCLGKMNEVAGQGRTVLFVSHNMGAVRQLCPQAIWLHEGQVMEISDTASVIAKYMQLGQESTTANSRVFPEDPAKDAQLLRIELSDHEGQAACNFDCDHPITITLWIKMNRPLRGLYGYLELQRSDGTVVLMSDSYDSAPNPLDDLSVGLHEVTLTVPARTLGPGDYLIYLNFTSRSAHKFNVDSPGVVGGFRLDDFTTLRGNKRPGFLSVLPSWNVRSSQVAPTAMTMGQG